MNICLVGDFSEKLDEGFKNTGHYLAKELEKRHTVYRLNVKQIKTVGFWHQLSDFRADIIHTIAQPTNNSFIFTYLLSKLWPKAATIISALCPERYFEDGQLSSSGLIKLTKPDLILVQSDEAQRQFQSLGCTVSRLSNGVDLDKFSPATEADKQQLRQKYGLSPTKPVVLHVGHLEPDRNLMALAALPSANIQVVVAGSLYMGTHHSLIKQLEEAGYHLFKGYQPNIAELYMLASCYVFPPKPGNSLAMPLSVLEAMACNLPIVTTRFAGLVEAFSEGESLKFVDHTEPFLPHLLKTLANTRPPESREMVKAYSWPAVAKKLENYYEDLVER
jgi:glycosyltransferase involved in cell wall biosynthesis